MPAPPHTPHTRPQRDPRSIPRREGIFSKNAEKCLSVRATTDIIETRRASENEIENDMKALWHDVRNRRTEAKRLGHNAVVTRSQQPWLPSPPLSYQPHEPMGSGVQSAQRGSCKPAPTQLDCGRCLVTRLQHVTSREKKIFLLNSSTSYSSALEPKQFAYLTFCESFSLYMKKC